MMNTESRSERWRRLQQWLWLTLAVAPALYAMKGVFSLSSIFYVRDLGSYFYPHYLWMRRAVANGQLPWWNPDSGAGYANISDPSFQLCFLPTLPLRFLLPETLGFNLMVAFPIIFAAIGSYLFLKRRVSLSAAALGSIVFSISGPLLSSVNSLNPATTAMLLPWLLWLTDALLEQYSTAKLSGLALLFALGVFAGQPDILFWEALLVTLYAGFSTATDEAGWRLKLRRMTIIIGSGALGLLLSAIQFLPLLDATKRSYRGSGQMLDGWSIHPLNLLETIMPTLFSTPLEPTSHLHRWLFQMNSGREPYLMSLYMGIATLIIALVGIRYGEPRRWTKFWALGLMIFSILALGYYTPVYKGLRALFPFISFFRYPSKLTIFMAFALAALTAVGFDAIKRFAQQPQRAAKTFRLPLGFAAVIIIVSAITAILTLGFPETAGHILSAFANKIGLDTATSSLSDMVFELKKYSLRLFGLTLCAALLLWIGGAQRKEARLARATLFVALVCDLLSANAALNPTMELAAISEPAWVAAVRVHPTDRIFVDEQSPLSPAPASPQFNFYMPPELSLSQISELFHATMPYNAIGYGLRDAVIVDVTKLRSQEYTQMIKLFRTKNVAERARFLQRAGVRYFLQVEPPDGNARVLQPIASCFTENLSLYESAESAPRVAVLPQAEIEASLETQFEKLFSADFDAANIVLLDTPPPAASGKPNAASTPAARITAAGTDTLMIQASAPQGGGYLLLRDSYDPNWRVEVDGEVAPLLRANGLYRAVRLSAGEHSVRFAYRPRPLFLGAAISLLTAITLLGLSLRRKRVNVSNAISLEPVEALRPCDSLEIA
ncbi:MAG: YfhO family protein [Acidobacteria bacterium]|nr:YfhO family protein [Acidobacteriota bacterium]